MLISHDKRFLFIHIPKTAGTSITNSLAPYADRPQLLWENRLLASVGIHVNHIGPWKRRRFRGHCSANDVYRHLPLEVYRQLFKFAFVRNPWDLLVSLYNFIPSRPNHRYQKRVAKMTFAEFVDVWTLRPEIQQASRITDTHGNCLVDFVGYFESVSDDFTTVCNRIGITPPPLRRDNCSRRSDYREAYDDRLRQLVGERLAQDIQFFGYEYDGPSAERRQQLQLCQREAA